jgi:hypothetical protein
MSDFLSRQAHKISKSAMAPVEAAGGRFLGLVSIGGIALLCLIATLIFLSVALDLWLSQLFDPIVGALGTACFYFVLVLICLLILWARRRKKTPIATPIATKKAPHTPLDEAETAARAQAAGLSANLEETVAPFLAILQQSGLKREAVAVQLATAASKELGPFALVALAVAAGFLSERQMDRMNRNKTKSPE